MVSSTEPLTLRRLGESSQKPEEWGVDFLWWMRHDRGWAGVQRKEIKDLIASVRDGRMVKEMGQWGELTHVLLIVEGEVHWTGGMIVAGDRASMTIAEWHGVLWRIQAAGAKVAWTRNIGETLQLIGEFEAWTKTDKHRSLAARPKVKSTWGRSATNREYGVHLLQSLPGVGRDRAERIWDHFDGVPLQWAVTIEELSSVKGVGRKTAEKMFSVL